MEKADCDRVDLLVEHLLRHVRGLRLVEWNDGFAPCGGALIDLEREARRRERFGALE